MRGCFHNRCQTMQTFGMIWPLAQHQPTAMHWFVFTLCDPAQGLTHDEMLKYVARNLNVRPDSWLWRSRTICWLGNNINFIFMRDQNSPPPMTNMLNGGNNSNFIFMRDQNQEGGTSTPGKRPGCSEHVWNLFSMTTKNWAKRYKTPTKSNKSIQIVYCAAVSWF